jgi:hypothetical protein
MCRMIFDADENFVPNIQEVIWNQLKLKHNIYGFSSFQANGSIILDLCITCQYAEM